MKTQFKISRPYLDEIKADLLRPHEFAYERVGFLYGVHSSNLILAQEYEAINDSDYIHDEKIGARFSGDVIRRALERSMRTRQSVFHTHIHDHAGEPFLSSVDVKSVVEISRSLTAVNPDVEHGCLILSNDQCKAYILKDSGRLEPILTSVIGFPNTVFNRERSNER